MYGRRAGFLPVYICKYIVTAVVEDWEVAGVIIIIKHRLIADCVYKVVSWPGVCEM